jgi:hypothetical protein
MTDRLDAALHALAADLDFPPTPEMRGAVVARIGAPARRGWWPRSVPRALALAIVVLLLAVAAVTAIVLAVPGLRLTLVPALPTPGVPDGPLATRFALGEPLSPETVAVGIPAGLGPPDEAYVLRDHEVLSLVYAAGGDLPEVADTGIGLLIQVIDGALDRERVEKLALESGVSVTAVEVNGAAGYWIEGRPHLIRFLNRDGTPSSEGTRLVGDTLVWEEGGVLYRIESGLGRRGTLRMAETIGR